MAAVRLIALHANKGKSVAQCLGDRTDYAKNPEKTEKGNLVTAYECDPMTVDEEFMLSKRKYQQITGREQQSDVIAYQIRQSFKPGKITAEEANRLGYELAMRFTKGKYAFIVARIPTGRISITMLSSTQLPWMGPESFRIFICPDWRFRDSVMCSAWSMVYRLLHRSLTANGRNEPSSLAVRNSEISCAKISTGS